MSDSAQSIESDVHRFVQSAITDHWDPAAIDFAPDQSVVETIDRVEFTRLRGLLAQFGASEEAVTEDLAPLAVVLDDPTDQQYIGTQMYDEVCHARLFDRYWDEVITPEEQARGLGPTAPDDRWGADAHRELVERTTEAMDRLLEQDDPETRAIAYAHYHLTTEGILAQAAYDWTETWYTEQASDGPTLPGLSEGFRYLRQDESRHVGFGVKKVRELIAQGDIPHSLVAETIDDLLPLVEETVTRMVREGDAALGRDELCDRIATVRDKRLEQIRPENQ
jgi:ribonucleoside-diphosphate reductase beta chain